MKRLFRYLLIGIVIFSFLFLPGCGTDMVKQNTDGNKDSGSKGILTVNFIDVGQADSILIRTPENKVVMIDAGNNGDSDTILNYLKNQGISKIDFLIGTHPHEDHIGSLDKVIDNFNVVNFYMPKVTQTTKTFKDVIEAAKRKNLTLNTAKYGVVLDLGSSITAKMLAPISAKYDDLNNYSAVLYLTYGKVSFLFMGDAQEDSEKEIISKGDPISADVLKVGHHGSNTSTGDKFLSLVNPKYAVISVGKDNDYGHPSQVTLNKLKNRGITIYRTDKDGTITASTDGNTIEFKKSK